MRSSQEQGQRFSGIIKSHLPLAVILAAVALYVAGASPARSAPQGGGHQPGGEQEEDRERAEANRESRVFWETEEGQEWENCRESGAFKEGSCPDCNGEANGPSADWAWEENRENHGGLYPGPETGPIILENMSELCYNGVLVP